MYIDKKLIDDIALDKDLKHLSINKILANCGVWETYDQLKDWGCDYTLEECFSEFYFIVDSEKLLFCIPNVLFDQIEESINDGDL